MSNQRDAWAALVQQRQQKGSKYGSKKKVIDNLTFDSVKESRRYQELKLRLQAGEIRNLKIQPEYPLIVHHRVISERGKISCEQVEVGTYRADFRYEEQGFSASENERWYSVVEDVKSAATKTPFYKLKKRIVEAIYGINIREV